MRIKPTLMSFSKYYVFIIISLLLACGGADDQKSVELREKEVEQKEEILKLWEEQLKSKELGLINRERQIDSLNQSDTLGVVSPKLVGVWKVTMQCIETTCEGSAIGDTKTEQWDISYQNTKVVVSAVSNQKMIRFYTGLLKNNTLKLTAQSSPDETQMDVVLTPHPTVDKLMEGQRVITQRGKCKIVYAIKASKQ